MRIAGGYGVALAGTAGALLLAGCGAGAERTADNEEATPHGYVEGAEETAEPQWRLVMAETDSGALRMLDPVTEEVSEVGEVPGVREATTDGRFVYLGTGTTATVFDSGTWTVDHGDHAHYYRAESDLVGQTDAGGGLRVAKDSAITALISDGGASVLDRGALEDDGEITEVASVDGAAALALGERLLVAGAEGAEAVRVLDREGGQAKAGIDQDCPDPEGQASTGRGAVFGCSDGALVVTEDGGEFSAERVPYPDDTEPVRSLDHRPTTPVLAGENSDGEVWVLDIAEEAWTRIDTDGPALAVSAAGERMPVLVLGEDGALSSHDPESGEEIARTELIEPPDGDAPKPRVWIDTSRAYVNDPVGRVVHEIDYNDDLRVARTFELDFRPDLMVETGW
ncbi:hypothetical protein [Halostreptopolyspora alba]|uniref:ABC transporter n=1 Tax=Halostreptopolyspora alba TaxID=2487137 RepID=A0A3N0E451_9ACTN|nr:hypothetical protein EFW17_18235 [Nocardiopsaceae bacterium YIM 96095]